MKGKTTVTTKHANVLLVDDNEIDNFINERMITSSNFSSKVTVKDSADSALAYLIEHKDDLENLPEVIFLDLNMPVKDGFAFLDEFDKLDASIKENTKIVVLSSSISPDDINKASINPYVFKYINKPLSEKYLNAINL
ncbi:MAG: response regulator [Bacteroidia bacterium]|nr:response regulator [Bacteroidia bacterium]